MEDRRPPLLSLLSPSPLRYSLSPSPPGSSTAESSAVPTRSVSPLGAPIQRQPSQDLLSPSPPRGGRIADSKSRPRRLDLVPLLDETPDYPLPPPKHKKLEVIAISGGSGANAITPAFAALSARTTFVLPISDNGGSSSEIIRVLGGPSIGDVRSRLIRIIPRPMTPSDAAIKKLLEHRLSATRTSAELKAEWLEIVEGHSNLWRGVLPERREVIRAFLVHFESEVLKRANKRFSFRSGSIGNFFLAGCMSFFRSLESAIFLFESITGIPAERLSVLPCIHTNSVATIAAELEDGSVLTGQMEISHPAPTADHKVQGLRGMLLGDDDALGHGVIGRAFDELDDLTSPDTNTVVSKDDEPALASRIRRIYYINSYGQEVFPKANPNYMSRLRTASCFVYCCGSLWTSIAPCLALRGVGAAIATSPALRAKVLLLNAKHDRECPPGMTAVDVVQCLKRVLNYKSAEDRAQGTLSVYQASDYVTHVLYLEGGEIPVEQEKLELLGIKAVPVTSRRSPPEFDERNVADALDAVL